MAIVSKQAYITRLKKVAEDWKKSPYSNSLYFTVKNVDGEKKTIRVSDHEFYSHASADGADYDVLLTDRFGSRKLERDISDEFEMLFDELGLELPVAKARKIAAKTNEPQAEFSVKKSEASWRKLAFRSMVERLAKGSGTIAEFIKVQKAESPKMGIMEISKRVYEACEKTEYARRVYFKI